MTAMLLVNSQEGGGPKPRGHRLYGLPLLLVNEGEEVVFRAGTLVLPEHAVLTAGTRTRTHTHTHTHTTCVLMTLVTVTAVIIVTVINSTLQ